MTAALPPEGAAGRRGNGLPSAEWGALVDLDPRLSEALLDSLAAEGVAAYVEPARDVDSYTRATVLPNRPLDRLWVNPALADLARGVVTSEVADLTALLAESEPGATAHGLVRPVPRSAGARVLPPPELPPPSAAPSEPADGAVPSDDELFRQIVAGFTTDVADPVPRWPVSEDLDPPRRPTDVPRRRRTDDRAEDDAATGDGLPGWVEPAPLEDEHHYEPPPPPKIPRPRGRTVLAALMVLLGFAVLFAPYRVGLDDSPMSMLFGLLLSTGGAALLVAWMRDAPPTDSGPDDGAVV
ncbi:MAG: hypothetical protein JWN87_2790 [Frankiales bacterium]|nr:hypothetical protein [Frankiales bacterium]